MFSRDFYSSLIRTWKKGILVSIVVSILCLLFMLSAFILLSDPVGTALMLIAVQAILLYFFFWLYNYSLRAEKRLAEQENDLRRSVINITHMLRGKFRSRPYRLHGIYNRHRLKINLVRSYDRDHGANIEIHLMRRSRPCFEVESKRVMSDSFTLNLYFIMLTIRFRHLRVLFSIIRSLPLVGYVFNLFRGFRYRSEGEGWLGNVNISVDNLVAWGWLETDDKTNRALKELVNVTDFCRLTAKGDSITYTLQAPVVGEIGDDSLFLAENFTWSNLEPVLENLTTLASALGARK